MVRRTDDAHLSSSRGLSADGVTCKPLAGAAVALLTAFGHAIDSPNTVCPKSTRNILSSTCHAYRSIAVDRFLSAGPFQSRDQRERSKPSGVTLRPLQGSALSVGLGVFLQRCATGASWIGCPRTLLTSRCVRAWQDRSRGHFRARPRSWALCSPTLRAARADMRLVRVGSRCEERGRRDRAFCSAWSRDISVCVCMYRFSGVVWS